MRRNPIYSSKTDSQNFVGHALTTGALHTALYGSDGDGVMSEASAAAFASASGSYMGLTIVVLFPDDPATTKIPNSRQINF